MAASEIALVWYIATERERSSLVVGCFFFSSRRRHTRYWRDWSSDVCSSDLASRACVVAVKRGFVSGGAVAGAGQVADDRELQRRADLVGVQLDRGALVTLVDRQSVV